MKQIIFLTILFPIIGLGQVQVFPTRLTLTEEAPSSYLYLKNETSNPQKYRIELVQYLMKKDGIMVKTDHQNNPLVDLLKFSPKLAELGPGEKQVVRVMATSLDSLADGEYYIYLHFIPDLNSQIHDTSKSKFSLQARIAVSVPIVVRRGIARVDGKLTDLNALYKKDGNLNISFKLKSATKYFLTGDLNIVGITDKGESCLSTIVGLTSYIPEREVLTSISKNELTEKLNGVALKKIKVKYTSNENSVATFELISETNITNINSAKKKKTSIRQ